MENVNIGVNHTNEVSKLNNVASSSQVKVESAVVSGGNKSKTDEVQINT